MASICESEFCEVCVQCSCDNGETLCKTKQLDPVYCCDKTHAEHWHSGWRCNPFNCSEQKDKKCSNKRKTGRAYRRVMKQQKDDRLLHIIKQYYSPYAGYTSSLDFGGHSLKGTGVYIKYKKRSAKQKFLKRQTSKKVRKMNNLPKGNAYRKSLDYWWLMY